MSDSSWAGAALLYCISSLRHRFPKYEGTARLQGEEIRSFLTKIHDGSRLGCSQWAALAPRVIIVHVNCSQHCCYMSPALLPSHYSVDTSIICLGKPGRHSPQTSCAQDGGSINLAFIKKCPCDQRLTEDRKTRTMTESTLLQNITEQLAGMMFTQNGGEGGKGVDSYTTQ